VATMYLAEIKSLVFCIVAGHTRAAPRRPERSFQTRKYNSAVRLTSGPAPAD